MLIGEKHKDIRWTQWTYLQALGAVILPVVILTGVFIRAVASWSATQNWPDELPEFRSIRMK